MELKQLETRRCKIRDEARSALQKMKDGTPKKDLDRLEAEHDALMQEYDTVADQIEDIRNGAEDRQMQADREARRLTYEPGEARTGDDEATDANPALAPEQRMTAWAQARHSGTDEYRGWRWANTFAAWLSAARTTLNAAPCPKAATAQAVTRCRIT